MEIRRKLPIFTMVMAIALVSCSTPRAESTPSAAPKAAAVKITMFYASPPKPAIDEKAQLCYGVENADTVRLEPAIDRVWPASTRCFGIPARAATYTLTAVHGSDQVSQTVTVTPVPPKPALFGLSINKDEFAPGDLVNVCYNARNAASVKIEPGQWVDPHGPGLGCIKDHPQQTTTYVITATDAAGDTAVERVTAHVVPRPHQ
jgi:hypothetical protein